MNYPILSDEENRMLASLVITGDIEARNLMIEENLGLVQMGFYMYFSRYWRLKSDLFGGGTLGLIRAVELYDGREETSFETFAMYWIRQSMNEVVREVYPMRIPPWLHKFRSKLNKFTDDFVSKHGCEPTREQCVEALKGDKNFATINKNIEQLKIFEKFDVGEFREEFIASPETSVTRANQVRGLLARLGDPHRTILEESFGFNGCTKSCRDIAQKLGMSKSKVNNIYNEGLLQVQHLLKTVYKEDYND